MGLLGFGRVTKLENLDVKLLKRERLTQEVRQDQLLVRLRNAQAQYDSLLEMASDPGTSDSEIDVAAYRMSEVSKTKDRAEQALQQAMKKTAVIDSTLVVLSKRMELEKKGIWKKINEIPEEQLENQLEELAIDDKKSQLNVDRIVEVFDVDRRVVQSERSPEFQRGREDILKKKREKDS
jgi:hypothetical protein